jgi:hypothetical protein
MIISFKIFYIINPAVHSAITNNQKERLTMHNKPRVNWTPFALFALAIFAWFVFPLFSFVLIAGVIQQGILGGFSGKVGPVVGGNWKDINYMRSWVKPANPNTAAQQTQRTRFTTILEYARQVLSTLIQPYWDPYYSDKSGFNAIMSDWLVNSDSSNLLVAACSVSKGTLAPQTITSAALDGTLLSAIWTENLVGNQLTTDVAHAVVFDKANGNLYFSDGDTATTRGDESMSITLPAGLVATNLECFFFFSQGSGSEMIISDSDHVTGQEA